MLAKPKEDNFYRVCYRLPKQRDVRMSYTSPDLASLLKNLRITEGVTERTVEYLVIHQVNPDNTTLEVVAIDRALPAATKCKFREEVREYYKEQDDVDLGYSYKETQDVSSLKETSAVRIKGFHFAAKPAVSCGVISNV